MRADALVQAAGGGGGRLRALGALLLLGQEVDVICLLQAAAGRRRGGLGALGALQEVNVCGGRLNVPEERVIQEDLQSEAETKVG